MVEAPAVSRFAVVRLDFLHALQSLLYLFGDSTLHVIVSVEENVEPMLREQEDGKGKRNDPEERCRQSPVVAEEADGNDEHTQSRGKQLGDGMGKGLFELCAVFHHGRGEVGEVALTEEGQRQTPQFFGYADASLCTFGVDGGVGAVVLPSCHQKHHHGQHCRQEQVEPEGVSLQRGLCADVLHKEEKQIGGRQHQGQVEQSGEEDASLQVFCPFFRQGKTLLEVFLKNFSHGRKSY